MRVAFDFDNTLTVVAPGEDGTPGAGPFLRVNHPMVEQLREHAHAGDDVYVVTARGMGIMDKRLSQWGKTRIPRLGLPWADRHPLVHAFVVRFQLPVIEIVFTAGWPKGPYLWERDINLLYDDQVQQRNSAREWGVRAEKPWYA